MRHAQTRAMQRYGISLSAQDYSCLCKKLRTGQYVHVETHSNSMSLRLVEHDGTYMLCAYNRRRHSIKTILPIHARLKKQLSLGAL